MSTTLVLYDTTGQWGWLGELYGIMTANLVSHFGSWTAQPVVSYKQGQVNQFSAVIYVGSTYGEPIPAVFLTDVLATTTPVVWIYDNIWQLTAQDPNFFNDYGWIWSQFDFSSVAQVNYKGQALTRYAANGSGIMNYFPLAGGVTTIATAVRSDSTTFSWALRSRNLTYIGENPLAYMAEGDRYLAFCDMLFDLLAPATVTRHRALVRLEDIDPTYDPVQLRSIADYLFAQGVPFGFHIIPFYTDPLGHNSNGVPTTIHLSKQTALVSALRYMQSKGGVMILHGYTHQYSSVINPYTAATGDDCEFFRLTMNPDMTLNYLGPVPEDSKAWATNRVTSAKAELAGAGFPLPSFWTFPSYLASVTDIGVIGANFAARAERSLYYAGSLSGTVDPTRYAGQFVPYTVKDVYNTKVLPDTLGGISAQAFFGTPARLPADIISAAQKTLVVRDGVASFFYDPTDSITLLQTTIQGIKSLGYTFVSPTSV
jgi:uncharacterized protein YdaL